MLQTATLANGCFWCTEAIFKRLKGVEEVIPGYSGGEVENPTYEAVSTGSTGHAEAIQIKFDSDILSFKDLLEIFFKTHDPTTLNRQGNDEGTQYRSAIFFHDEEQRKVAEQVKADIDKSGYYSDPIVTEITQFKNFYPAEDYHQNFYNNNRSYPYCKIIIDPKIKKFLEEFSDKVEVRS
jgi:peptide-methionine (S)-S-oxide reductase